jgi:hypothetical protein
MEKVLDTFIPTLGYCGLTMHFGKTKYLHMFLSHKKGYCLYNGNTDIEEFLENKELLVAKIMVFLEFEEVEKIEINGKSTNENILVYENECVKVT